MNKITVLEQLEKDLTALCVDIENRHPGSPGNKKATAHAAKRLEEAGFEVTTPEFECIDWEHGEIVLEVGGEPVEAFISPYSLPCGLDGGFETAGSLRELYEKDFAGKIMVLHGEMCREQLAPKHYVFYNPEHHREIYQLLEEKLPLAVVAITGQNPETAGGQYPFPLMEDGDFNIPAVYLTEEEGQKIFGHTGSRMVLKVNSRRIASTGCNVIGRKKGNRGKRVVFCGHIDTKKNTPGALDNGASIAALLTLADLLQDHTGDLGIEILILNGEDYYAASGELLYLAQEKASLKDIVLAVNSDMIGCLGNKTVFSYYECSEELKNMVRTAFGCNDRFAEGTPWPQSDHMVFAMNGVPAVALTSENIVPLMQEITHTDRDTIENADFEILYQTTLAMKELVRVFNEKC